MRLARDPERRSATRSHVMRGSSSEARSDGYFPESMASTSSNAALVRRWYGYARLTSAKSSSTLQSSTDTHATITCASTSSAFCGTTVGSTSPSRMAPTIAAISTRSSRNVGTSTPRLVCSSECPARPTRCKPADTRFGDWSWITRSTDPMSIPSSSELVATSAGSSPALSARSRPSRRSRASEPWYGWASSFPASAFTRAAIRSACARLLTNTSVVRARWMYACTSSTTFGHTVPPTSPRSGTGETTASSICLTRPQSTMVTAREAGSGKRDVG